MIAAGGAAVTLFVAAATSLNAPMEDAAKRFETLHPGIRVVLSAAASGVLLAQIEHGAPVDLFVSASSAEMDRLEASGRIAAGSRVAVASNRLVLVVPAGAPCPASLADLAGARFGRIALGNPKTVPAGRYAAEALRAGGIARAVQDRLVFGESARQVLDYVVRGEVDVGLVYRTDAALGRGKISVGAEVPADLHSPIVYQGGVIAGAPQPGAARAFLEFLVSEEGRATLASHGFGPPPCEAGTR